MNSNKNYLSLLPDEIYRKIYAYLMPLHEIIVIGNIYNLISEDDNNNLLCSKYNSINKILSYYEINKNKIANDQYVFIVKLFINYSAYNENEYFLPITDDETIQYKKGVMQTFYTDELYKDLTNILYFDKDVALKIKH